jgi:hypothetical protein
VLPKARILCRNAENEGLSRAQTGRAPVRREEWRDGAKRAADGSTVALGSVDLPQRQLGVVEQVRDTLSARYLTKGIKKRQIN